MAMIPNQLPRLVSDPTGRSLGLDLPPGALAGPVDDPYLWSGREAAGPKAWRALRPAARTAGLLPVLLGGKWDLDRWELEPGRMSDPADHDAEEVLAEFWEANASDELPGAGDWPGLAPALPCDTDPDGAAAAVAEMLTEPGFWLEDARPALVPARRSADIPAVIGWGGPLNHENDVARLCAVLRSWEDRFGARVVALTFDQLVVSVAAPPRTAEEAEAVAREHFAFCPDSITQGHHDTLRDYARKGLVDTPVWTFWWD
ncbi:MULTISPECIES: DUF4253 domain-containing protein [unclassified Streptomyces]|uniref:DUF4253 domain-containing protein n=1 Tax=unclassified Streptomyces TaxID=2593676 RepID=UPI0006FD8917|nr:MULTISPECIES: DUF4253 domain-containing protein [unclassified Streptomyces]KQX58080.1 hypothetical protein ASD33_26770 [Streptomyces sp. Root1304]KRA95336.1 hypothetical protein ASE09_28100 [Streptomyces sp. Root66D1]